MPFIPQVGLAYVRGCEVDGMLDENGKVIEEGQTEIISYVVIILLLMGYLSQVEPRQGLEPWS